MKDDLRHSLDELFSDFEAPTPEPEEAEAPPPPPEGAQQPEPPKPGEAPPPEPPEVEEAPPSEEVAEEPSAPPEEDVQTWRRQLIRTILRILTAVGGLAVVAGSYNAYSYERLWRIPVYVGAYAVLAVAAFYPRFPYKLQVGVFLTLVYGLGAFDLFGSGRRGDGRIFLLAFPILVAIFLGRRRAITALLLSILTLAFFAWAFSAGRIPPPPGKASDLSAWVSVTAVFSVTGGLLLLSQMHLVPRLTEALARSRSLSDSLRVERDRLKRQTQVLQEANYALQRRAMHLEASAEVGQSITSIFEIDELLRKTVNLIRDKFKFYHAGIFLIDDAGEWAVLQEATGEAGAKMKAQGHRLRVEESSMVGWTALHREPRIALDVGEDAVRFDNPLLPHTRSEMTLPIMVGERLLGVLNVQSVEKAAFDEDDVRALQSMADQIAVAIQNARQVSDQASLLEATSPIYRASRRLTTAITPGEVADAIIDSVAETEADGCLVVEFESTPDGEPEFLHYLSVWRKGREPQFQPGTRLPMSASPFPLELVSNFWEVTDVDEDDRLPQSARQVFEATGIKALVNVPLRARERVIGQVVVLRETSTGFSDGALRLYEMLSDQAAIALERARLLEETRKRARRESAVREIADKISAPFDLQTTLRTAVEELSATLGASGAQVELSLPEAMSVAGGEGPSSPQFGENGGDQPRSMEESV